MSVLNLQGGVAQGRACEERLPRIKKGVSVFVCVTRQGGESAEHVERSRRRWASANAANVSVKTREGARVQERKGRLFHLHGQEAEIPESVLTV